MGAHDLPGLAPYLKPHSGLMMEKTEIPQAKDPAVPVGTPPGGGSWTWNIDAQQWVEVVKESEVPVTPVNLFDVVSALKTAKESEAPATE